MFTSAFLFSKQLIMNITGIKAKVASSQFGFVITIAYFTPPLRLSSSFIIEYLALVDSRCHVYHFAIHP